MSQKNHIDLEQELSHFNGHHDHEDHDIGEKLEEIEFELEFQATNESRTAGDHLVFVEHEGALYFVVISNYRTNRLPLMRYGKVSNSIQLQGEAVIRGHAEERMREALAAYKRTIDEHDAFCSNSNVAVAIEHEGVELRGRILSGDGRYYHLCMEHPYQIDAPRNGGYNQWSAQSGVFMFGQDNEGKFCYSKDCIENAKRQLIELYKGRKDQERNAASITLAKNLNRT